MCLKNSLNLFRKDVTLFSKDNLLRTFTVVSAGI